MEGYIKNPETTSSEDLEQAADDRMIIEEAVLATLKPLPTNYLDDEAMEPGEAGNGDNNESPPTKKSRKLSFKKYTKVWSGRKRFRGWTDAVIHQMIDWYVSYQAGQTGQEKTST
jgi:hypothetical protein